MSLIERVTHAVHRHFLPILIVAYFLAAVMPQFGLWIRQIQFGQLTWIDGGTVRITLPMVMLSFLLFNAGLGIKFKELVGLWRRPALIGLGFLANIAVPILLVIAMREAFALWHNSDEIQNLLVGLAMIISMPIAGSSTAWSQNANGNLSLSLGLVFLSTLLSPVTAPLILRVFGFMTTGDYSEDLHELAASGTNAFMAVTVVFPSLIGVIVHFMLGEEKTASFKPYLKLANFLVLLLLNYSNGATSLPQSFAQPDVDFLILIYGTVALICGLTFTAAFLIAKWLKADRSDQAALMFGLGMNNNGTGLVLAAGSLPDHPIVLLPIICYTLVQQVMAAVIDRKLLAPEAPVSMLRQAD